jgi:hypothetical protein
MFERSYPELVPEQLPDELIELVDGLAPMPPDSPEQLAQRARDREEARATTYYKVATFWHALGFVVVPGNIDKEPLVPFAAYSGEHAEPVVDDQILQWALNFPDAVPLLLPSSGCQGLRFVFVDADHPAMSPWIEATFGRTPLTVATGRPGGGRHHYYLEPDDDLTTGRNMMIGPDDGIRTWDFTLDAEGRVRKAGHWGCTWIDVKARRGYCVAPLARHKTGRIYTPSIPLTDLTIEWLRANVPVFRRDLYEAQVKYARDRRALHQREIQQARRSLVPLVPSPVVARAMRLDLPTLVSDSVDNAMAVGRDEPFLDWCRENHSEVNFELWWGLANNIASVYGEDGRKLFHEISA